MKEFNGESAVAIARLIVTIVLAVGATFGWSIDGDLLLNIILSVLALAVLIYTWWKNNNVTVAAQQSQLVLDEIKQTQKDSNLTDAETEALVDKAVKSISRAGN